MNLQKLKDIKDFSLLIIPSHQGIQTKSHRLGITKMLIYMSAYSFFIFVIILLLLIGTPAGNILMMKNDAALREQNKKLFQLNRKVLLLTHELQGISAANKRLKLAIAMGDSNLAKTMRLSGQDKTQKGNPLGGDIYAVVEKFFREKMPYAGLFSEKKGIYFLKPVGNAFISRGFDASKGHMGIDFAVRTGTSVTAAASGYVAFSGYTADDGYMLILVHDEGYITIYKHCSGLTKKIRDRVVQGETIALSGNTGLATTGPHLHFEIWKEGQVIDPKDLLIN
ncbi:MAG: M23 family metallopeptidase [Ignavibacteria bacterium]|jgi:murein DD-endopeptidase MepM/ murein hydrolase activator NlpD|nr:M23 family metallopeptidase [Ignavibacteria bacterium]HEX2962163.1 M23 family metallopeptidase [Ignavibacteriales bacterium]MCU7499571.1 M23 family metallopeptidase [Ignavibacteria bacterium]MCU7513042.1 M23 family metallopeptidase [Ignavibacteria bacterium]MCU7519272.1 M23 family metallopeptidase [Ignavibacteria bacterium]